MAKVNVMFVCLGNICRSPLAEFVLKQKLEKAGLQTENAGKLADAQEILDRAENFRIEQIEKYGAFEAKLQALEILKSQIRAILGTDNNDD